MLTHLDGRHVYSTNESMPQPKLIKQASSPINTQAMETKEASEALRSPLALKNILTIKISALTPFVILSTYCKYQQICNQNLDINKTKILFNLRFQNTKSSESSP